MTAAPDAKEISARLAERITSLAPDLLPDGHREGHEWRCGSVAGEPGGSLGVRLAGAKAGIWSDFAAGIGGDALDLVRATLGLDMSGGMAWARRWLGIDRGDVALPHRQQPALVRSEPPSDPDRWQRPWRGARPIAGTLAEKYLSARGLRFTDAAGEVLRFAERRARLSRGGELEHHPALVALLSDISGEPVGVINIYLRPDGSDRLRDKKAKTITGRARGAAVMLSAFDEPTHGLVLCEGIETGIAILMTGLAPLWACGGAGTLANFPVLGGIEALTIAADADPPGQRAAEACAARWRQGGREVAIVAPPAGDWADQERAA